MRPFTSDKTESGSNLIARGVPACRYKHHIGVTSSFPVQPRRRIHADPESCVSLPAAAARRKHIMDFLVDVGRIPAGQPVAATLVRITEPPASETEAAMNHSEEDDSDYAMSTTSSMTLRKAVMAGRKPDQLVVPAISSRHRLQFQGWRTCHAFFSSLI
ncbi:hypothetical protein PIB30_068548 [Stylosanthes scabra]|uniref:Uncharacterized protein n=1 Tax=Stylosanthes scabra TaxID=79078 RepID=A0ABU6YKI9_9FABA|nr:hypothetical protein [Stylosanthes scabra]